MADDHGHGIIAANLVVAISATIAVALRFLARLIQKVRFQADDFLILLALVCRPHLSKLTSNTY